MRPRSVQELWASALGELQVQVTRENYETWLQGTTGVSFQDRTLTIGVSSTFAKEWLQKRLSPLIKKTLSRVVGDDTEVQFLVVSASSRPESSKSATLFPSPQPATAAVSNDSAPVAERPTSLNPKYTFLSFVVGSANRFAHAAAICVADNPGQSYNPFFLYGGSGLGKTHLLHAIGQRCTGLQLRVLYVTSEQFTNQFINALRERRTEEFRSKYRSADVLLIDDIQFIADKEQTQESFFHTFNDLHNANRQIILSSDRPHRSMPLLEDRLRSRFEWGLIADIQPPDLETRIAILHNKAEEIGASIDPEILNLIAQRFQGNVRELEGALNRVLAFANALGTRPTLELAANALSELIHDPRATEISPATILAKVASHFSLQLEDLTGARRSKELVLARQTAMYLMRKETKLSLAEIGQAVGGRDHSTVIHGCEKIASASEQNTALRRTLMELTALVRSA